MFCLKKLAKSIQRIGLVANSDKPSSRGLVRKAVALIRAAGRQVFADAATARLGGLPDAPFTNAAALTREVDLLMVFGGDGTMLRVARETAGSRTPIVGINAGSLGFLTDVQAHQLPLALRQILAGQTVLESRPLIEARGRVDGRNITETALNDFVISRGAAPRLIELAVTVDAEPLTRYRCDGLIVCTPTGSTAYSLSAGGAVVSPNAEVLTLTPICPHTLSNRSLIVSLDATIRVKVLSERVETILTADGQKMIPLATGDEILIRRSRQNVRLLHLAGSTFFETLRRKLNWRGSNL
ncbi:MAG: kinase [Verrucomicrobiota bacterium]